MIIHFTECKVTKHFRNISKENKQWDLQFCVLHINIIFANQILKTNNIYNDTVYPKNKLL